MHVIAISGSLRRDSTNTNVLQAIAVLFPDVELYDGIGRLPHFNPDLDFEGAAAPPEVAKLRSLLRPADAIVISTPEYAHALPGVLKNALDWLVSDGTLVGKRVLIVNATPPAEFAQAQLAEVLKTMNWRVVATVDLPLRGRKLTAQQIADDRELASRLREAMRNLG